VALCACAGVGPIFGLGPRSPERPPLIEAPPADLPAPEGLRVTSGRYRVIPIQWDPLLLDEVGGYLIERSDQREGPFSRLDAVWGHGTMALVDRGGEAPLGDGQTVFYRMRAFSAEGRVSALVTDVVVGTTAPLPDAPKGLRTYSDQPREVPLSWRASENRVTAGYVIERSPAPDGPFEVIESIPDRHATAMVDSDLGDLRVFYYRIRAFNRGDAVGPPSDAVRAVTKPDPLPPFGLHLSGQRLGENVLSWEPNVERDIEEYRLLRRGAEAESELVATVPGDATEAVDRSVASGETVSYTLVAVDRNQLASRPSKAITATGVGYDLSVRAGPGGVHLRWNPRQGEGFVGARIERSGWLGSTELGRVEGDAFVDPAPPSGGTQRYVVVLLRADGSEAPPSRPTPVEGAGSR
jgi:hypothetical protein